MAYKAMRRSVMEPHLDAKLREQAKKVYDAIGLEMPEERSESEKMPARNHGGGELVSTFVPTPKGPKLNVVHGPRARQNEDMFLPEEIIGFPIVGAGARARRLSGKAVSQKPRKMDVDDGNDIENMNETPYFYPRRDRKSGSIRKRRGGRPKVLKRKA